MGLGYTRTPHTALSVCQTLIWVAAAKVYITPRLPVDVVEATFCINKDIAKSVTGLDGREKGDRRSFERGLGF